MSLNYATYFRDVQKPKYYLYLRSFSVFIYGNFTSKYYVQFQIENLQLLHVPFQTILDISETFLLEIIQQCHMLKQEFYFDSWSFFKCLFLICTLRKFDLYIITYFGQIKCFIPGIFLTHIHKNHQLNHSPLFSATFPNLEMARF